MKLKRRFMLIAVATTMGVTVLATPTAQAMHLPPQVTARACISGVVALGRASATFPHLADQMFWRFQPFFASVHCHVDPDWLFDDLG